MSAHYKAELHIKTAGETDNEEERIERFLKHVQELARMWNVTHQDAGIQFEVSVGEAVRN